MSAIAVFCRPNRSCVFMDRRSAGSARHTARFAEAITTPLLVFGAGHDRVTPTPPIREFVKRLPHANYVEIEDAEHEILMENDAIRARFWREFDAFVEARLAEPAPILTVPRTPLV